MQKKLCVCKVPKIVVGLDLSLTATGVAAACAICWSIDLSRVSTFAVGEKLPRDASAQLRASRLALITNKIVEYVAACECKNVFVEGYSYGKQFTAHQLGELGGAVKYALWERRGVAAMPVPPTSVRKFFLGRSGKGSKDAVADALKKLSAPFKGDEGDAFVVMNFGIAELGYRAMAGVAL